MTSPRSHRPSVLGSAAHLLLETAAATAEHPAVVDGDQVTSYGQLAEHSLGIAEGLRAAGVEPGQRVAILLQRGAAAAAAFFGVLSGGGVAVQV
ncbi:MAG TPA: AMP-binding protein, partial [Propionibacteriaceae bacterium]|nr:AMP-binding protein [Propionibacteriaceae bacterium]